MKTYFLISLLAIFARTNLQAQGNMPATPLECLAIQSFKQDIHFTSTISIQNAKPDSVTQPIQANRSIPPASSVQKNDQFTRGSLVFSNNFPSDYSLNALKYSYPPIDNSKSWKLTATRLTVGGFALVARTLPYFLKAIRTKAGLRFCCQKTTFGTFNKARKKVTGITFAIPIGHNKPGFFK
ncbi:MAG: hypothetical protein ABIN67_14930 [Ferruginibacter sp.]